LRFMNLIERTKHHVKRIPAASISGQGEGNSQSQA